MKAFAVGLIGVGAITAVLGNLSAITSNAPVTHDSATSATQPSSTSSTQSLSTTLTVPA